MATFLQSTRSKRRAGGSSSTRSRRSNRKDCRVVSGSPGSPTACSSSSSRTSVPISTASAAAPARSSSEPTLLSSDPSAQPADHTWSRSRAASSSGRTTRSSRRNSASSLNIRVTGTSTERRNPARAAGSRRSRSPSPAASETPSRGRTRATQPSTWLLRYAARGRPEAASSDASSASDSPAGADVTTISRDIGSDARRLQPSGADERDPRQARDASAGERGGQREGCRAVAGQRLVARREDVGQRRDAAAVRHLERTEQDLSRLEGPGEREPEVLLHVLARDEHGPGRSLRARSGRGWEIGEYRVRTGHVLQRVERELEGLAAEQRLGIHPAQRGGRAILLRIAEAAHLVTDSRVRPVEGEVALLVLARRDVRLDGDQRDRNLHALRPVRPLDDPRRLEGAGEHGDEQASRRRPVLGRHPRRDL